MIRQPPINRLIDKTLALDEPRKRVILRLLYSLYSIHNRKSQIAAKMIFSGAVSMLSILISCIVLVACNLESAGNGVITFISAAMLAAAQIAFATRLDLNHPHFSRTDDGEIKEANSTVSVIILTGLVVCFVIGLLLLYNTLKGLITGAPSEADRGASYAYAICLPLALLAGALAYFFVNLKKAYDNLDTER